MLAGAAASTAWFSALTYIATRLRENSNAETIAQVDPNSALVNVLVYGMVLGITFTFIVAWTLMAPIDSRYRRGGLSMVSALGGSTLAGALTYLSNQLGGPGALIGLGVVAVALVMVLARRARAAA